MNIKLILLTLPFIGILSCAPKVQEKKFEVPKSNLGPRLSDKPLQISEKPLLKNSSSWTNIDATSDYFSIIENLYLTGKVLNNSKLQELAQNLADKYYSQIKQENFSTSPYIEIATYKTKIELSTTLNTVLVELEKGKIDVTTLLENTFATISWPKSEVSTVDFINKMKEFFEAFYSQISHSNIYPPLVQTLEKEIPNEVNPLITKGLDIAKKIDATSSFAELDSLIHEAIAEFELELDPDKLKQLETGKQIAKLLKFNNAQGALTLLIEIWNSLTPQERVENFKKSSPDLYKYLKKQSASDLNCLANKNCLNLLKVFERNFFVLPKLNNYGLTKLRRTINESALLYARGQIKTILPQTYSEILKFTNEKIANRINLKIDELRQIQENPELFIQDLVDRWSLKNLDLTTGKIFGLESKSVQIKLSTNNTLNVRPVDLNESTPGIIGKSFSVASLLLQSGLNYKYEKQLIISQINKLLSISGYRDHSGQLKPGAFFSVDKSAEQFDIEKISFLKQPFYIQNHFNIKDNYQIQQQTDAVSSSVENQAALLKGLSQILYYLSDWNQTSYDKQLGNVLVKDVLPELDNEAANKAIFPKSSLAALALGNTAVLLKNLTKDLSPLFLVTLDNKIIWSNEYLNSNNYSTSVTAGIVDIVSNQRTNIVYSKSVSEYLIALTEFYKAITGIQNTNSEYIQSSINDLIDARQKVKLLIIALANYISHDLVNSSYQIKYSSADLKVLVQDQFSAIKALVSAYEATGIQVYLWSAIEIYYALNHINFDPDINFYVNVPYQSNTNTSELNPHLITEGITTLHKLSNYLPVASQIQLDKITYPWIRYFEKIK